MKYKKVGICGVSIDLVLATGRKVNICPDRFRKFLLKWEFTSFVCFIGLLSGVASYMALTEAPPVFHFAVFWTIATLIITSLYVLSVSFASLSSRNKATLMFEPFLTTVSAALSAPMCFALMTVLELELHFPGRPRTFFFIFAALTLEVGVLSFVYLLRDYLITKYCLPFEKGATAGKTVVVGSKEFQVEEVRFVQAENQYVRIFYDETSDLFSGQLIDIAKQLSPEVFVQPHRSYLVLKHAIQSLDKDSSGGAMLRVVGGHSVPVSRRRRSSTISELSDVEFRKTA